MSKAVSRFVDAARWIAALLVALHHTHNSFVNQADIMQAPHAAPVYVWWFITAYPFAHGAVVVFFVLSGFLVGGVVFERAQTGRAYLRNYLIDRASRIYIVLLPALALGFVLDMTGNRIFAGLGVYELPIYQELIKPVNLLPTLVSLQGVWFPTFGTNIALWSLGMEFWYYIICGLVVLPLSAAYAAGRRWAGFALGVAIFVALAVSPSYFLFGAAIWALGAVARMARKPLMRSKWLALTIWAIAVVTLRLVTRGAIIEAHPLKEAIDSVNALLFANLLLTLRFDAGEGFSWCRAAYHRRLSDFAYSLYATHWPILMWLSAISILVFGAGWNKQLATPLQYLVAILAVLVLMVCAFAFSRVTEARTDRVRTWARQAMPGGARSATQS